MKRFLACIHTYVICRVEPSSNAGTLWGSSKNKKEKEMAFMTEKRIGFRMPTDEFLIKSPKM
jgi:hypothetical protein